MEGFYKQDDDGEILYGPNYVYGANYTLLKESHTDHEYPIDGWYWFDSREDALAFFGAEETL
jgi:hypothetical protein